MNANAESTRAGPIVREVKRLPAESFTLFHSANVSRSIGVVLRIGVHARIQATGSGLRIIQLSLDFDF